LPIGYSVGVHVAKNFYAAKPLNKEVHEARSTFDEHVWCDSIESWWDVHGASLCGLTIELTRARASDNVKWKRLLEKRAIAPRVERIVGLPLGESQVLWFESSLLSNSREHLWANFISIVKSKY
jgi:hypothetical protein